ncbi:MAG: hypothetical protein ACPGLV_14525 [Bacteroidia bacterium]
MDKILYDLTKKLALPNYNKEDLSVIKDIGLLLERHQKNAYKNQDYKALFTNSLFNSVTLSEPEFSELFYLLFYVLINFQDERSSYIAQAFSRFTYPNSENSLARALKIYYKIDDVCTHYLLMALLNYRRLDLIKPSTQKLLLEIATFGSPKSKDFLISKFSIYKQHSNFDIWKVGGSRSIESYKG